MAETTEFVTRDELRAELAEFKLTIAGEINTLRVDMNNEFKHVHNEIDKLRVDMHGELNKVHAGIAEIHKSMVAQTRFFIVCTAGMIGVALGIVRLMT